MSSVTFPFRQSFHSIIAGAATGAGLTASVSTTCVSFGLQVELGPVGTPPTTAVVTLEGSCDGGTKWFTLGTWTLTPQASGDGRETIPTVSCSGSLCCLDVKGQHQCERSGEGANDAISNRRKTY